MLTPEFQPYVPATESPRELTVRALITGAVLGVIFAASSVYLALKLGLTVSASIPVAVLSITILRKLGRPTILENNIVQTTGSAGESIAAGVAFTLPALLLLGQDLELLRVLLVALFGGLLGVLMMIPLRHGLIVKEHGKLTYPEGTACAEVLIAGEKGGSDAKLVFAGFFLGLGYGVLNLVAKLWKETASFSMDLFGRFKGALFAIEVSPAMLGVGYIIGVRTAANMMAGGVLSFMILIPLIHLFGDGLLQPMFPAAKLIKDMSPSDIRNAYVLYIGAGAVATGGIISLLRSLPTIVGAFKRGLAGISAKTQSVARTERDLPMKVVLGGTAALLIGLVAAPMLGINLLSGVLIILFGFFFTTVSSRITGEIGSSSNPISGMTVATLLITCLLFLLMGWTGVGYRAMALTMAAVVCVAASNGGATSQDLKTGYLVGATPRSQQLSLFVGVVTSAIVIGWTMLSINRVYTTYPPVNHGAYRAQVQDNTQTLDGATYHIANVMEPTTYDGGTVPTGRYLATRDGELKFLIDPGIGGTDTERDGKIHPKLDAPKARLFSLIVDGILTQKLPWGLVLVGVLLALMMELVGVSALPFAVGVYLPISTSAPIFVGGVLRHFVDKQRGEKDSGDASPGMLMASGLIAGGAIAGLLQTLLLGIGKDKLFDFSHIITLSTESDLLALVAFVPMSAALYFVGKKR
jgi:putative OPT family oligopeptide transporter